MGSSHDHQGSSVEPTQASRQRAQFTGPLIAALATTLEVGHLALHPTAAPRARDLAVSELLIEVVHPTAPTQAFPCPAVVDVLLDLVGVPGIIKQACSTLELQHP